jgi:5-methylcytosine-specific restriction endonuclease McrA
MPVAWLCPKCGGTFPSKGLCESCERAKWRTDGAQRRERDKAAGGSIYRDPRWNQDLKRRILRRDKFKCYYGTQLGWEGCEGPGHAKQVAHIEPPSGVNDPRAFDESNLAAACATCNRREQTLRSGDRHRVDI